MARPGCVRYLKRERKNRAHSFKGKGGHVGAISSATEEVAVSHLSVV